MSTGGPPRNMNRIRAGAMGVTDWFLAEILRIMKMHLRDYGILFFDTVDMNLAYPVPNTIHMPLPAVKQELFMILSMICL